MKINHLQIKTWVVILLTSLCSPLNAQDFFDGPIQFKGRVDESHLSGKEFNIEMANEKVTIACIKSRNRFHFDSNGMVLRDAVLSINENFAAVSLQSRNWKEPVMSLVILSSDGIIKNIDYRLHRLSDNYGWVVELAAISNDGKRVLAKCARMIHENGKNTIAGHDWVMLSFEGNKINTGAPAEVRLKWERMLEPATK